MWGLAIALSDADFKKCLGLQYFATLHEKRMEWAEQLLRQGNMTIAKVAHRIGYSHQGRFAEAFKRRFLITPSECSSGKKSVSEL